MKRILNTLILVLLAGAVIALLTIWLRPRPTRVDSTRASRGPMQVTVDGEGKTRVRDRYVVATPVAGQLRRITLRRGDLVARDDSYRSRNNPVETHAFNDTSAKLRGRFRPHCFCGRETNSTPDSSQRANGC